jgi:hypothetical protein
MISLKPEESESVAIFAQPPGGLKWGLKNFF